MNKGENTACQNLWDEAITILRGKPIALYAYIRKEERPIINCLSFHVKQLEKKTYQSQSK